MSIARKTNTEQPPRRDAPPLPLGDALDFLRRLWRLDHALERVSRRMERDLGVTAQQRLIVRCIGKYPGVTAGQLAELLHVDPGTMSSALSRLVQKRLVRRRRDPVDKRRLTLALTETGRALDVPTVKTIEAAVQVLLARSTAAEKRAGIALLERFVGILEGVLDDG
ncbi:MAG: MarR family transcriptional regulator [Polyangiaceae bacterium]